jgi:hypothetical protein
MRTTSSLVPIVVVLACGSAHADPTLRFGLTSGADRNTPEGAQIGPHVGLGARSGQFVGEVNYAYLSFLDPYSSIHRAGVALRMEVARWIANPSGTYTKAIYLEVGAGKRWGTWRINEMTNAYANQQYEAHLGFGYELSRSWQLAVRLGGSRRHPELGTTCRGVGCTVMEGTPGGIAQSVMFEWMFLIDR